MTKIEFLSASLPYNQKIRWRDIGETVLVEPRTIHYLFNNIELVKPIIRPLSDLTKECVEADYNNGEPFVPTVVLRRLFPSFSFDLLDDSGKDVLGLFNTNNDTDMTICDIIPIIQLLLKWHFNLMDESVEVVNVTEEFNPYK